MDYEAWFAARLAALRMEKDVSARDMSLSLGQSESYINKIENRRTLPSLKGFFYICAYLEITPEEFFNTEMISPGKTKEIVREIGKLSPAQAEHVLQITRTHKGRKNRGPRAAGSPGLACGPKGRAPGPFYADRALYARSFPSSQAVTSLVMFRSHFFWR